MALGRCEALGRDAARAMRATLRKGSLAGRRSGGAQVPPRHRYRRGPPSGLLGGLSFLPEPAQPDHPEKEPCNREDEGDADDEDFREEIRHGMWRAKKSPGRNRGSLLAERLLLQLQLNADSIYPDAVEADEVADVDVLKDNREAV